MWPFSLFRSRKSGLEAQPQYLDELPDEPVKMSAAKKGGIAIGGSLMAYWLAFCSLAGIILSVIVPLWAARKLRLLSR